MDRISTISNLILKVPQILNQRGDVTAGILSFPLSHLNNVIYEAEGVLMPMIQPYYDLSSSKIKAWSSNPESLVEDLRYTSSTDMEEDLTTWYTTKGTDPQTSGEFLKSHIELNEQARTQFVYFKFFKEGADLKVFVFSDEFGKLGEFDYGEDIDVMAKAGFKLKGEGFEGLFRENNILSFSIYRYSPDIVSLFSLKTAITFLEKTFTNDMPESPATAGDYQTALTQALNQLRFGRAHLRANPNVLDTSPISMPYEIDETGTDITRLRNSDY